MKIYSFLLTLFFTLISFNVSCDELKIRTNKDILIGGEAFYLTISYDGSSDSNPNLDSLKNDFQIVSNSFSRSVNIVNGNISQSKNWRLGLIPLKEGKIKIKPVKLDNLISNDLDIEVKELTDTAYIKDSKYNSNAPFFQIKQTADTVSPYIQQQVTFLVTIYDSIGLKIKNITTNYEASNDWVITPILDTPIVEKDVIDGKQVNVIHYAFAGFPQKSGKIKEPRFIVDGYYLKNNDFSLPTFDDDFFNFGFNNVFNQQVPVKMQTKEKLTDVKPIPSDYTGKYWLPLFDLTLNSEFKNIDNLKQGDAFNQLITISAKGLQETLFPQLHFPNVNSVKIYPEKPQLSMQVSKGYIETTATINNVYIPNKTGTITIPETEIEWFNLNTRKMEKSIIPQKIITVQKNPNIISEPINENHNVIDTLPKEDNKKSDIKKENVNSNTSKINNYYVYLYYFIGFVLFILLLFVYNKLNSKHIYRNNVIKSLKRHDYRRSRELLIEWAKYKFDDKSIKNINDISKYANDEEFTLQLSFLNKMIYSDTKEFFNYRNFIEIFKKIDKIKYSNKENKKPIPLLYD
jgi:hypothetical protein